LPGESRGRADRRPVAGNLVDQLAARLNQRLEAFAGKVPAHCAVARAALSDDAPRGRCHPAFTHRLLPTRTAPHEGRGTLIDFPPSQKLTERSDER
jgi:hypothetical protein